MSNLNFVRSQALNNIPQKKLQEWLSAIEFSDDSLQDKDIKSTAINRYAMSNIPVEYWNLKMERDFKGDVNLLKKYNEYTADLKSSYINGRSICFAGSHGVGKSFVTTSILKKACQKGFSCHYSEISSVVSVLTQAENEDKFNARRELSLVDFLVLDELDPRFFNSEASSELFAKCFESIFRIRKQNKLPTLLCTNSPNLIESFPHNLKQSIGSLFSDSIEMFSILAEDFRKKKNI